MNVNGGLRFMLGCCTAVALLAAGCGGGTKSTPSASSTTAQTTTQPPKVIHGIKERLAKPKGPGAHPGAKIDQLIVKDVVKGRGDELHAGDTGIFDFIASDWVSGAPIDASWNRKRPFEIRVDHNVVIDGWWQGLPGMRVGGRRQLIIPPSLGFQNNPNPKVHGKTTYFDVVLLAVKPATPAALTPPSSTTPAQ